jgi:hypothetical protein
MTSPNPPDRRLSLSLILWRAIAMVLLTIPAGAFFTAGGARAADNADVEMRIKAAYIYNFARFVVWPGSAATGPLRIGILGRGEMAVPLEELTRGKSANGRPIEVRHLSAATEADCCEILLIERSELKHLKEIGEALAGKPVLTVCDSATGLRDGVMIAFQIFEETIRFQINQQAAEHAGLKISSQLLKVAVPMEKRR